MQMNDPRTIVQPLEQRVLLTAYNPVPSFGDGGLATEVFSKAAWFQASLVAEVSPHTVLVVGMLDYNSDTARRHLVMAQFDAKTGELNQQFGTGGKLTSIDVGKVYDAEYLSDGKVVILGGTSHGGGGGGYDPFVARFTPAGDLDPSFSDDGIAELEFGSFEGGLVLSPLRWRVAAAPDGKLVVMGQVGPADPEFPTNQTLLARLKTDGSFDKAFDGDGVKLFSNNDPYWLADIAVQKDGKVLVADFHSPNGVLRRFTLSGAVDTAFGQSGVATLPGMPLSSVYPMSDGRILANAQAGRIARLTSTGELDTSFGDHGTAPLVSGSGTSARFYIEADGRISVLCGGVGASRFTADGQPDPSFGIRGNINFATPELSVGQSVFATDGDILMSGSGDNFLWLARYTPQTGNIVLQPTGRLIITDTLEPDTITVDVFNNQVRVDINGAINRYLLADVTSIQIDTDRGDDVIGVNVPLVGVSIAAGEGNDSILISGGGDAYVLAGAGNDTIITGAGDDSISADEGDDSVSSGDGNDTILASMGNNTIDAGAGDDLIRGERLTQIDKGGNGTMLCDAGDGDDTVKAGSGPDTIRGGAGIDHLFAGDGDNLVYGGAGDDCIKSGAGSDTLWGEIGYDSIKSGFGDDVINGGAGKDHLWGQKGNDRIDGQRNNDVLDGGPGEDRLVGGQGFDKFFGRNGNDVVFARDHDRETIDGGAGVDSCDWDDLLDVLVNVEGSYESVS